MSRLKLFFQIVWELVGGLCEILWAIILFLLLKFHPVSSVLLIGLLCVGAHFITGHWWHGFIPILVIITIYGIWDFVDSYDPGPPIGEESDFDDDDLV